MVLLAAGIALKFLKDNAFIKDAEDQIKASLNTMLATSGLYKLKFFLYVFYLCDSDKHKNDKHVFYANVINYTVHGHIF